MPIKFPKFTKLKTLFTRKPKKRSQIEIDINMYSPLVETIFKAHVSPEEKLKKLSKYEKYVQECKVKATSSLNNIDELYQYDILLTRIEDAKELIIKKQSKK